MEWRAALETAYRLLRRRKLLAHRDRTKPRTLRRPLEHVATGPNQVWAWDITYLRAGVRGTFWYLYAIGRNQGSCRVKVQDASEVVVAVA